MSRKKKDDLIKENLESDLNFSEVNDSSISEPQSDYDFSRRKEISKGKQSLPVDSDLYSKYYVPRPRTGARGGQLGRKPVGSKRKIQFSVSCTKEQKEEYIRAAEKDGRKLPEFVNAAIEEYIKRHNLH